jgi:hypothetical protein
MALNEITRSFPSTCSPDLMLLVVGADSDQMNVCSAMRAVIGGTI